MGSLPRPQIQIVFHFYLIPIFLGFTSSEELRCCLPSSHPARSGALPLPGSSYGKRLPEAGITRELPPTLPRARDGHPCPRAPHHFQECFAAGFFTLRAV